MASDAEMSSNSNKINSISASTGMQEKSTWVSADRRKKQDLIKWLSPVAWQHINLLENMSFLRKLVSMNMGFFWIWGKIQRSFMIENVKSLPAAICANFQLMTLRT